MDLQCAIPCRSSNSLTNTPSAGHAPYYCFTLNQVSSDHLVRVCIKPSTLFFSPAKWRRWSRCDCVLISLVKICAFNIYTRLYVACLGGCGCGHLSIMWHKNQREEHRGEEEDVPVLWTACAWTLYSGVAGERPSAIVCGWSWQTGGQWRLALYKQSWLKTSWIWMSYYFFASGFPWSTSSILDFNNYVYLLFHFINIVISLLVH